MTLARMSATDAGHGRGRIARSSAGGRPYWCWNARPATALIELQTKRCAGTTMMNSIRAEAVCSGFEVSLIAPFDLDQGGAPRERVCLLKRLAQAGRRSQQGGHDVSAQSASRTVS